MNIIEYVTAIKQRFGPKKIMRRQLPREVVPQSGIRDTGVYNAAQENEIRTKMGHEAYYAEQGALYDPNGKYLCGDCKFRTMTDLDPNNGLCTRVEGLISLHTGSCNVFEFGNYTADDELSSTYKLISMPDVTMNQSIMTQGRMTKEQSGYMERPISRAFGCFRCAHGKRAKYTDRDGRTVWCRAFGCHVAATACCASHTGIDAVSPRE